MLFELTLKNFKFAFQNCDSLMGNACLVSSSILEFQEAQCESSNVGKHALTTLSLKKYSFADIKMATGNFRSDAVIWSGWYTNAMVFKGWIDEDILASSSKPGSGMMVAIKKFEYQTTYALRQMQLELSVLERPSHPNVIKLLGYCFEGKNQLLVYEFMQRGGLDKHLFNTDPSLAPISWDTRIKIAIGAARGLVFLHSSENPIIYRDLNPSNILLDGKFNPKISGFGLSELGSEPDLPIRTRHFQFVHYIDPECFMKDHLDVKSDVYSFGAVLLEILTGSRVDDMQRQDGEWNLFVWAEQKISNRKNLRTIMDVRLNEQYSKDAAFKAAQLALKCLRKDPQTRPTMKEVLDALEMIQWDPFHFEAMS